MDSRQCNKRCNPGLPLPELESDLGNICVQKDLYLYMNPCLWHKESKETVHSQQTQQQHNDIVLSYTMRFKYLNNILLDLAHLAHEAFEA